MAYSTVWAILDEYVHTSQTAFGESIFIRTPKTWLLLRTDNDQ